jgi:hypothetical protein
MSQRSTLQARTSRFTIQWPILTLSNYGLDFKLFTIAGKKEESKCYVLIAQYDRSNYQFSHILPITLLCSFYATTRLSLESVRCTGDNV